MLRGNEPLPPAWERICGSVAALLAVFHIHTHTTHTFHPTWNLLSVNSRPHLSSAVNALGRFTLGSVSSC